MTMTAREVIGILSDDGWFKVSQTGSHAHYKHNTKSGKIQIAVHAGDMAEGTLRSIFKQAGIPFPRK